MRIAPSLILLMALPAASAAASETEAPLARTPSEMSGAEIDAYNQGRAANDPDYIRCRRIEQVGSLVKKLRVCNTNAEWRRVTEKSSQDARDTMEVMARGWSNSKEPSDGLMTEIRPQ